jgi:hypothetical protein
MPEFPLPGALQAYGTEAFNAVLKAEIEQLDRQLLPLQQGLTQSSHAVGDRLSALVLGAIEEPGWLHVRVGLFYHGIIAGCSCADDPTPLDEINEYCEVRFDIDTSSALARVSLLSD